MATESRLMAALVEVLRDPELLSEVHEGLKEEQARLFATRGYGTWRTNRVKTGALKRSLTTDGSGHVWDESQNTAVFGTRVQYARWLPGTIVDDTTAAKLAAKAILDRIHGSLDGQKERS